MLQIKEIKEPLEQTVEGLKLKLKGPVHPLRI
jgi:hypothetical protein